MEKLLRNKTYKIAPVLAAIFLFLIADTSIAQEKHAVDDSLKKALIILHNFDTTLTVRPDYDSLEWALSVLRPHAKTDEARASLDSFETSLRRMRSSDSAMNSDYANGVPAVDNQWNHVSYAVSVRSRKKVSRGVYRAWVRTSYVSKNQFEPTEETELMEINCSGEKMRSINSTFYYPDGSTRLETKKSDWQYPIPDSDEERILYYGCTGLIKYR
jgi:hypothetical protein